MCFDPVSMMMVAGTAISAAGSVMEGQAAFQGAKAQAGAYNQQAEADAAATGLEVSNRQREQRLATGSAIAQVGSSGVGLKGSPTTVLREQSGEYALDLAAIKYGSQVRQNQLRDQGKLTIWQGKQARTAGFIKAGTTIFDGAAGMYSRGVRFSNPFARRDTSYRSPFAYG